MSNEDMVPGREGGLLRAQDANSDLKTLNFPENTSVSTERLIF